MWNNIEFRIPTWRMMKQDQKKQDAMIIKAPFMRSCLCAALADWSWGFLPSVHSRFRLGPLIIVIKNAPPTATMVPNIFAWLCSLLILTISSLQTKVPFTKLHTYISITKISHFFGLYIQWQTCICWVKTYLNTQAMKNAEAGRILHMADVKEVSVYFIPR